MRSWVERKILTDHHPGLVRVPDKVLRDKLGNDAKSQIGHIMIDT